MIRRRGDTSGGPVSSSRLSYLNSLSPVALWVPVPGRSDLRNVANPGTHDATLNGDAAIGGSSPLGQALVLDGTGDYAEIAHDAAINPASSYTIVSLCNISSIGSLSTIAGARNGTTDGFRFQVGALGTLRLQSFSAGAATLTAGTTLTAGEWITATAGRDGTNGFIYLNGASDVTPASMAYAEGATSKLGIGGEGDGTNVFPGSIALVAVFNTALTATQIARIHNDLLR